MIDGDLDLREPAKKFADCSSDFKRSRYVVYGIPYDATATHMRGASKAPEAIRDETYNFETYLLDLDVDLLDIPMADIGDLVVDNSEDGQHRMIEDARSVSSFILENEKFPVLIGGEHSVSEGPIDAFMEMYQRKGGIAIILDAHLDFRDEYMDNPHSHACVARRIFEKWGRDSLAMLGIRSGCREEVEDAERGDLIYVTSKQIRQEGIHAVIEAWDGLLSIRDRPIYLSIDMDVFDPSFAPGTGTPEPWGLSSLDVRHFIEELRRNIVAMDIVEVAPTIESHVTPSLAGKLIRQTIGLKEMVIQNPTWLEKI